MTGKIFSNTNFEYEIRRNDIKFIFKKPKYEDDKKKISKCYIEEDSSKLTINWIENNLSPQIFHTNNDSTKFIDIPLTEDSNLHYFLTHMSETGKTFMYENSNEWFSGQLDKLKIGRMEKTNYIINQESGDFLRLKLDESKIFNENCEAVSIDKISKDSNISVTIRFDGLSFFKDPVTKKSHFSSIYNIKELCVSKREKNSIGIFTDDEDESEEDSENNEVVVVEEEKIMENSVISELDEVSVATENVQELQGEESSVHVPIGEFLDKNVEDTKTNETTQQDEKNLVPLKNLSKATMEKDVETEEPTMQSLGWQEEDDEETKEKKYRALFNKYKDMKGEKSNTSIKSNSSLRRK